MPIVNIPEHDCVQQATLDSFHKDGVAIIPAVLTAQECDAFCRLTDRLATDERAIAGGHVTMAVDTMVLRYIQALDRSFADLAIREPIYSCAVRILGAEPKLCGMNVIRSYTGQAISAWHIDDTLEAPLADGQVRHDPAMLMPVQWFTVQVALTDIQTYDQGPTEYVPGSHYSGRNVDTSSLLFEGRGPEPVYCKAGDAYLFNHQTWHRGAPNVSPRTRYLMQIQYTRNWIFRRFSDTLNTVAPPHFEASDLALARVLGLATILFT